MKSLIEENLLQNVILIECKGHSILIFGDTIFFKDKYISCNLH